MGSMVVITGGPELAANIARISAQVKAQVVESALNAGAKVVHENAQRGARVATGELRDSIKIHPEPGQRTIYPQAFYGLFVEEGTGTRYQKRTGKSVGRMPKSPFLKPALHDPGVETAIKNNIRANIEAIT